MRPGGLSIMMVSQPCVFNSLIKLVVMYYDWIYITLKTHNSTLKLFTHCMIYYKEFCDKSVCLFFLNMVLTWLICKHG